MHSEASAAGSAFGWNANGKLPVDPVHLVTVLFHDLLHRRMMTDAERTFKIGVFDDGYLRVHIAADVVGIPVHGRDIADSLSGRAVGGVGGRAPEDSRPLEERLWKHWKILRMRMPRSLQ